MVTHPHHYQRVKMETNLVLLVESQKQASFQLLHLNSRREMISLLQSSVQVRELTCDCLISMQLHLLLYSMKQLFLLCLYSLGEVDTSLAWYLLLAGYQMEMYSAFCLQEP